MCRVNPFFGLLVLVGLMVNGGAVAQNRPAAPAAQSAGKAAMAERANANTVTVISGTISGTFIQIANDMSFVLDDSERMRVLPAIGKGAEQNLYDVLLLRGIDVGIVRSDRPAGSGCGATSGSTELRGREQSAADRTAC